MTTYSGGGTLVKTGAGDWQLGGNVNVSMGAGGLIDVRTGTLSGSSSFQGFYADNVGSLAVASGATFRGGEANVRFDTITGAGTYNGGYYKTAAGPTATPAA